MKKVASAFSKASIIVCAVNVGIMGTVILLALFGVTFGLTETVRGGGSSAGDINQITSRLLVSGIYYSPALVSSILGLVFSINLRNKIGTANNKKEIIAPAVCTIIFGFPPAGIIALIVPPSQYRGDSKQNEESKEENHQDEQPKEEVEVEIVG